MARTTKDILRDINETKSEEPPPYVDIEGVRYYKSQSQATQAAAAPTKGLWQNPRRPNDPPIEVEFEEVAINIAPYSPDIRLDGVIYFAGRVYRVPQPIAQTIREICQRTWQHEASTGGAYSYGTTAGVRGTPGQAAVVGQGGVAYA